MITLYHCHAARSFRPLWMREEMGLPYDLKMLPFPPRVFAKEYLAINPLGSVPAIDDDGVRMADSIAIMEYLTETMAEGARLDHVCEWEDGSWRIRSAKIRLERGLRYDGNIDLRLAGMVALCDGKHTLGEILERTARQLGEDLERITPNCVALMRQLIERGFVVPAGE